MRHCSEERAPSGTSIHEGEATSNSSAAPVGLLQVVVVVVLTLVMAVVS